MNSKIWEFIGIFSVTTILTIMVGYLGHITNNSPLSASSIFILLAGIIYAMKR